MKKRCKKLNLDRETVRHLDGSALRNAPGGDDGTTADPTIGATPNCVWPTHSDWPCPPPN